MKEGQTSVVAICCDSSGASTESTTANFVRVLELSMSRSRIVVLESKAGEPCPQHEKGRGLLHGLLIRCSKKLHFGTFRPVGRNSMPGHMESLNLFLFLYPHPNGGFENPEDDQGEGEGKATDGESSD